MFTRNRPIPAIKALLLAARQRLIDSGALPMPIEKAGVPASGLSDLPYVSEADGLIPLIEEQLILTRLPGAQQSPFLTRLVVTVGGAVAFAVGEKKPIPAVPVDIDPAGITPFKFASLTVLSNEQVAAGGAVTERAVQNALVRGVGDVTNGYILGSAAASDAAPAGFGFGVTSIAATSDPIADIRALIAAHAANADITSSAFVTDALTAAILGTVQGPDGGLLFPDCGVAGGEILGLPVLVTRASPREDSPSTGSLFLIDGSAVAYGLDQVELTVAKQATVELSTAPTGDGDVPTSMSQQRVSLFQNELQAVKCIIRASWRVGRAGAISVLSGIDYQ
jgi:hypothetical protein